MNAKDDLIVVSEESTNIIGDVFQVTIRVMCGFIFAKRQYKMEQLFAILLHPDLFHHFHLPCGMININTHTAYANCLGKYIFIDQPF